MLRLVASRTPVKSLKQLPTFLRAVSTSVNAQRTGENPDVSNPSPTPSSESSPNPALSGGDDKSTLELLPSLLKHSGSAENETPISGVPVRTSPKRLHQEYDPSPDATPVHVIPFNTHRFYLALEQSFHSPVARTLMKATRGMLVDRIRATTHKALHVKDFDNGAYLFRAALSELRTELTMRTRKDTATLRTTLTALRKEVDILDAKMKEDIASLKHEIQMDTNNRKTEATADSKRAELGIEDILHRTIVHIGDLRTEIEQAKWDNTRRGVAVIGAVVAIVILGMELSPKRPPPPPPPSPPPPAPIIVERPLPSVRELEASSSTEFDDSSA